MAKMKLVYICSPFRGNAAANTKAARRYCREAYEKGYFPIAPHLYFPQFLDDDNPAERDECLRWGLRLINHCSEVWVFGDKISAGMKGEIEYANSTGKPVVYLPGVKTRKSGQRTFTPPTLEEVKEYVAERGNKINAQQFYDYFNTPNEKGEAWIDSKGNPVRNWKQKVITWETKGGHARPEKKEKVSNFFNYRQRRYTSEQLKHIGLNLMEDI